MLRRLAYNRPMYEGAVAPRDLMSYFPLAVVLLVVGFAVTFITSYAASPGPESGSIGLTGVVPGEPPSIAPTISSPSNGQHFSTTPITVKGTCPSGTLVELFKNDIFAGSTFCDNKTYSIDIDLLYGRNDLIARGYDDLNQSSPTSSITTVYYDASGPQASGLAGLDFGGAQLLLNTDAVFRGVFPDKEMSVPLTILGGKAPFAINIQWGDSEHSLVSRNSNAVFASTHVYKKPGTYPISVQATDADGRVAFITVAAIVNGQPDSAATAAAAKEQTNMWLSLWPLYVATIGIVFSFWLGERREKHVLAKHHQLISQV
jgi:hypothetical protein